MRGLLSQTAAALVVALVAHSHGAVDAKSPIDYEHEFASWMQHHGLRFTDALEYARRLENYITNDLLIVKHNTEKRWGFTLGHNEFSHLSFDEFKVRMTGLNMPEGYLEKRLAQKPTGLFTKTDVPDSIDWVEKGAVTPVKNQGMCGSCWAFSATGALEGAAFVASGNLPNLSEQELLDCDTNGDMACNGGLMDHAFAWIESNGGLCTEAEYPYHAKKEVCQQCKDVVKVTGFQDVDPDDEKALKVAVAQQPVSIAIEADQPEFQFYKSGVFDKTCGTRLDHGVLVVGYGTEGGQKFWKVKNSWGASWGENGYIRLSREAGDNDSHGQCGIAMAPSYPFATMIKSDAAMEEETQTEQLEIGFPVKSPMQYAHEFGAWMKKHHFTFSDALEYARRLENYITNDVMILKHNAQKRWGFTLGHNEYSHLSFKEFKERLTGFKMPEGYLQKRLAQKPTGLFTKTDVPDSIDWVEKGAVTPVKNQGMCGSCWAFSATGALEGAAFVTSGKLLSLSEQELLDCDNNGDMACNGGLMDNAFAWIESNGGICTEAEYPYHAKKEECKECKDVVKVTGFQDVDPNDENALKVAVAQQPVSIAIEADQPEFQFYKSGVFDKTCGTRLDHGVLVVGYGTEGGQKFWKVKNSWGASWGENGYIRLSREAGDNDSHGQCGLAMAPSYPFASLISPNQNFLRGVNDDDLVGLLGSSATVTECSGKDDAIAHFKDMDVTPKNPKRGKPVTFSGSGDIKRDFESANFNLVVRLAGEHVFGHTGEMCGETRVPLPLGLGHIDVHGFSCPMKAGKFSDLKVDVNLPIIAPSGNYEIALTATDTKSGDSLFCVKIGLDLNGEESQIQSLVYDIMAEM